MQPPHSSETPAWITRGGVALLVAGLLASSSITIYVDYLRTKVLNPQISALTGGETYLGGVATATLQLGIMLGVAYGVYKVGTFNVGSAWIHGNLQAS